WQLTHANAGGVTDRISDRGGNARQADFTDPTRSQRVELLIGEIQEMHLDAWRVRVHSHDVVREVAIDRRARLRVVIRVFEQRHADAHHHRALNLVATRQWVEN